MFYLFVVVVVAIVFEENKKSFVVAIKTSINTRISFEFHLFSLALSPFYFFDKFICAALARNSNKNIRQTTNLAGDRDSYPFDSWLFLIRSKANPFDVIRY
jgi:hypothetical protein